MFLQHFEMLTIDLCVYAHRFGTYSFSNFIFTFEICMYLNNKIFSRVYSSVRFEDLRDTTCSKIDIFKTIVKRVYLNC